MANLSSTVGGPVTSAANATPAATPGFSFGQGDQAQQQTNSAAITQAQQQIQNIMNGGGSAVDKYDALSNGGLQNLANSVNAASAPNYAGYAQGANDFANYTMGLGAQAGATQAPELNFTTANQNAATAQQGLNMLQQTAAGNGPSQSGAVLQQGVNAANANALSLARSGTGNAAQQAAAQRNAAGQAATNVQNASNQAAQLKSQEQLSAMSALPGAATSAQQANYQQQLGAAGVQQNQQQMNQQEQLGYLGLGNQAETAQLGTGSATYGQNLQNEEATAAINAGQKTAIIGGAAAAGGAALTAMSDIRNKEDIRMADDTADDDTTLSKAATGKGFDQTRDALAKIDAIGAKKDSSDAKRGYVPNKTLAAAGNALSAYGAGIQGRQWDPRKAAEMLDARQGQMGAYDPQHAMARPALADVAANPRDAWMTTGLDPQTGQPAAPQMSQAMRPAPNAQPMPAQQPMQQPGGIRPGQYGMPSFYGQQNFNGVSQAPGGGFAINADPGYSQGPGPQPMPQGTPAPPPYQITSDARAKTVSGRLMQDPPDRGHAFASTGRSLLSGPADPNRNYNPYDSFAFNRETYPAGMFSDARAKTEAREAGFKDGMDTGAALAADRLAKNPRDAAYTADFDGQRSDVGPVSGLWGPHDPQALYAGADDGMHGAWWPPRDAWGAGGSPAAGGAYDMSAEANGNDPVANAAAMQPPPARPPMQMSSDERGKNVGVGDMSEADHFLATLKPYTYRYKDPSMEPSSSPTGGEYLGVMAQNVEQAPRIGSQIVKDTPRGKVLEGGALQSALAAGVGRLHERVAELEQQRKGAAKETVSKSMARPEDEKKPKK